MVKRFIGGFIVGLFVVMLLWPRRRRDNERPHHMTVFRMDKCEPCQSRGEILQFRYGATHLFTENDLGEQIPGEQRRWMARSWNQRCQDCHGHGEQLRIWNINGDRTARAA